jgi:SAM-dependent methyltransferase
MTWVLTVVWSLLALVLLLDAFRMRGRAAAVPVLEPSEEPVAPEHCFLVAPGVALDEATRRAASAHARKHGLRLLDLVPRGMPWLDAWSAFQLLDPVAYRKDRLGRGMSFGHAALVDADVLARAGASDAAPADAVALLRAVGDLKRYACTATDLALAPALPAVPRDPRRRLELLRELVGGGANVVLIGVPVVVALLVLGAVYAGVAGLCALGAFHLQPLLAFAAGPLAPRQLVLATALRTVLELVHWAGLVLERPAPIEPTQADARRQEYQRLLEGGVDRLFEPRVQSCPICDCKDLVPYIQVGDLLQNKPGRFSLERCNGCAHVFQNPRLSIEGLDFYYKDFYDGLGGDNLDRIFGASGEQYIERANIVRGHLEPSRWLDVGGGHGHFCCAAREVWPAARFDALDLSESIDEAKRRGWVDEGYRGLFPELASKLSETYDVVSMSHYLEHTREPQAEIEAAARALSDGGLLLIEVPDPDCPMGRLLGRFWLPWFQPQHQHLLSVKNIERLLRERGFTPVLWHRGRAHITVDFLAAVILFVNWLAPEPGLPWRPPRAGAAAFRAAMFTLATPALIAARLVDAGIGAVITRTRGSNAYRVLARKNVAVAAG